MCTIPSGCQVSTLQLGQYLGLGKKSDYRLARHAGHNIFCCYHDYQFSLFSFSVPCRVFYDSISPLCPSAVCCLWPYSFFNTFYAYTSSAWQYPCTGYSTFWLCDYTSRCIQNFHLSLFMSSHSPCCNSTCEGRACVIFCCQVACDLFACLVFFFMTSVACL